MPSFGLGNALSSSVKRMLGPMRWVGSVLNLSVTIGAVRPLLVMPIIALLL